MTIKRYSPGKKRRSAVAVYRPLTTSRRRNGHGLSASLPSTSNNSSKNPNNRLTAKERVALVALSALLPLQQQQSCHRDPRETIARATSYIQHLTNTVIARVRSGTLPEEALSTLCGVAMEMKASDDNQSISTVR